MREEFKSFFDHRYLCRPWGGNSILYTAEYAALAAQSPDRLASQQAYVASSCFIQTAILELPSGESFSHDDMTALVCLAKQYGFDFSEFKLHQIDTRSRLHPRDIIFYMYAAGGIYRALAYPLLPILTICMVESVLNKTYKTINGVKVLATDGALLTFLRLHTFKFPITKFLVDLSLKFHKMKWSDYFLTYFGPDHPNYILSEERQL